MKKRLLSITFFAFASQPAHAMYPPTLCQPQHKTSRSSINDEQLIAAAIHSDVGEVSRLINAGANVNYANQKGNTALIAASINPACDEDNTIMRTLLAAGANPNHVNARGNTPLMVVQCSNKTEILIRAGANPDYTTPSGLTPLRLAHVLNGAAVPIMKDALNDTLSERHDEEIVSNSPNASYTPLKFALINRDYSLAKLLLSSGMPLRRSFRPYVLVLCKTREFAQLLLDHGAEIPPNMLQLICERHEYSSELLAFYLRRSEKYDQSYITSVLWKLLEDCQYGMHLQDISRKALILIQANANLLQQDPLHKQFTALHYAADGGSKEICLAIIDHFIKQHKGFLQFLAFLRKNYLVLYQTKGLLQKYFSESASHHKGLITLLTIKDKVGARAWHRLAIDELQPDSYKLKAPEASQLAQAGAKKHSDARCVCF